MEIEQVSVESLIPYARNSRTHSDAQVAQIAASIKEFGWTNPILVDGENGIIAGHGRLMAARKLGMEYVPVIKLDHLSKAQKQALIIADNKLALNSGWDEDMLKVELQDLIDSDFELELVGFDADELNLLFNGWQPDADVVEKNGENLAGILSKIVIKTDSEQEDFAKQVITNALDSAGINYEF